MSQSKIDTLAAIHLRIIPAWHCVRNYEATQAHLPFSIRTFSGASILGCVLKRKRSNFAFLPLVYFLQDSRTITLDVSDTPFSAVISRLSRCERPDCFIANAFCRETLNSEETAELDVFEGQ
jgi:hypothetical protein